MNRLIQVSSLSLALALVAVGTFQGCADEAGGGGGGSGGTVGGAGGAVSGAGGTTAGAGGTTAGAGGTTAGAGGATAGAGGATAGSGGAAAGSGGAAGSSGSGGASGGVGGVAAKMAQATIAPINGGTITGTVTFVEKANGVEVTYALANCPAGVHGTHIHAGTGCADTAAQGMHWGPTRGENIGSGTGEITCNAAMTGTLVYLRTNVDPNLKWSIGDNSVSDVLGHPVVIHGLVAADRHGCGVIQVKN